MHTHHTTIMRHNSSPIPQTRFPRSTHLEMSTPLQIPAHLCAPLFTVSPVTLGMNRLLSGTNRPTLRTDVCTRTARRPRRTADCAEPADQRTTNRRRRRGQVRLTRLARVGGGEPTPDPVHATGPGGFGGEQRQRAINCSELSNNQQHDPQNSQSVL